MSRLKGETYSEPTDTLLRDELDDVQLVCSKSITILGNTEPSP